MKLEAKQRLMAAASFLPARLVMVDCEMTGLDPAVDDVIQLSCLKLELEGIQYKAVDEFNIYIHTDKQPESDFAKKYLIDIYRKANSSTITYPDAKELLHGWLSDEWLNQASPTGDCVPTDILFLYVKGVINLGRYEGDTPVPGTFHYEYFEANPLKLLARTKAGFKFDKQLPRIPGDHDAMVDCKNQLTELNGIIEVLLS